MPASAASLPPELMQNILDYIASDPTGHQKWMEVLKEDKQELSACSLTCIYWANKCRQRIFNRLILRSSADVKALVKLVNAPTSPRITPLWDHVWLIVAAQDWTSARSWVHDIHNLINVIKKRGNSYAFSYLSMTGHTHDETHGEPRTARSIHWDLPRTLPLCYHPYTFLKLQEVHCPNFANLLAILRELSKLQVMECNKVTWDPSLPDPAPPTRRTGPALISVQATECTDNALLCCSTLWQGQSFRIPDNPPCFVHPLQTDVEIVQKIVGLLHGSACSSSPHAVELQMHQYILDNEGLRHIYTAKHNLMRYGEADVTTEDIVPQFTIVSSRVLLSEGSDHIHTEPQAVEQVTFNFDTHDATTSFLSALEYDWNAISAQILLLSSLQTIMFSFRLLDDLERFVNRNQAALDVLRERTGLVLAYKNMDSLGIEKFWLEADKETLKPTGRAFPDSQALLERC